jgi:two-component system, NarL family, nitrate/nitrite response regulator NarL
MRLCLVCDDHAMMRTALAGTVELGWPGSEVLTAADFPQAWTAAQRGPDLILCDLSMPGAESLDGVARVAAAAPDAKLLVVTGREDDALLMALFDLGVAGFVPKSASGEILEAAIRLVLAGGRYLPPRIYDLARGNGQPVPAQANGSEVGRLTERQIDVLRRMAQGSSNKEIALALNLSPATVKTHAAAIIAALGVANRTEAAIRARELRLI